MTKFRTVLNKVSRELALTDPEDLVMELASFFKIRKVVTPLSIEEGKSKARKADVIKITRKDVMKALKIIRSTNNNTMGGMRYSKDFKKRSQRNKNPRYAQISGNWQFYPDIDSGILCFEGECGKTKEIMQRRWEIRLNICRVIKSLTFDKPEIRKPKLVPMESDSMPYYYLYD